MKQKIHRRPQSNGFTLIEVMIVIVIIAVLAVLGMYFSRNAIRKAQETKALGPIRAVAVANMEYGKDNQNKINTLRWDNDPKDGGSGGTGDYVANSYWGRFTPYLYPDLTSTGGAALGAEIKLRLNALFDTTNCSKMTGTWLQGSRIYHEGSALPIPFAFNNELYKFNNWERTTKVSDLAQIMYVTYGFGTFNIINGQSYAPRPTDGSMPKNSIYYLDSKKAMVTFLDGHVEMISPPIPQRKFK